METPLDPLAALAAAKYLSLTTFRRDGRPVATPVWLVRDGDCLRVITDAGSGKAKRIANDGRVQVAPCDMRGRLTGEPVDAVATLDDPERTRQTRDLITRRYGLLGRLLAWRSSRSAESDQVGITVRLTP